MVARARPPEPKPRPLLPPAPRPRPPLRPPPRPPRALPPAPMSLLMRRGSEQRVWYSHHWPQDLLERRARPDATKSEGLPGVERRAAEAPPVRVMERSAGVTGWVGGGLRRRGAPRPHRGLRSGPARGRRSGPRRPWPRSVGRDRPPTRGRCGRECHRGRRGKGRRRRRATRWRCGARCGVRCGSRGTRSDGRCRSCGAW